LQPALHCSVCIAALIPHQNPEGMLSCHDRLQSVNSNTQGWPKSYIYRYTRCTYGIFSREIYIQLYTVQIYTFLANPTNTQH
jgi:hypothetical protein